MRNVLEYLEYNSDVMPDKIFVEDEYGSCTFREMRESCRRIGSFLLNIQLSKNQTSEAEGIGIFMDKGIASVKAFFGSVYAGYYYVPLNIELSDERLENIQSVLNAPCIITDFQHYEKAVELFSNARILLITDLIKSAINNEKLSEIRRRMIDTDPLYAIFTSGSTGIPKGILVCHRSVIDFIDTFTELFSISNQDVIGNQAPFDFDVSVKDIYCSLKKGALLSIIPRKAFTNPTQLMDWICDRGITVMVWAVSALCLITSFHGLEYRVPEKVRQILFSGEVMPLKHLQTWRKFMPDTTYVNLYGPSEITCNCTYHILDQKNSYEEGIPIGVPFPNEDVFLLDKEGNRIDKEGIEGEICVRGTTLALGYLRAPEQNGKFFTNNPLNNAYPERIYHTGDLGQYRKGGKLYFTGRRDFQIKYMGHRIELEEIEHIIDSIKGVERCICIFDEERKKLYAYFTGGISKRELYILLRNRLPAFMVPGAIVQVNSFPLNKNGKVDRKALRNI